MSATLTESGPCKVTLAVTIKANDIKEKLEENFLELQKTAQIKGFRPGRCPLKRLKRLYGSQVTDDVKQDMLRDSMSEAIKEHDLDMIGSPKIENKIQWENEEEEDFTYELVCYIKPEFDVDNYTGIEISVEKLKVSDENVEETLTKMRLQSAALEPKEEGSAIEIEDLCYADIQGNVGDEEIFQVDHFGPLSKYDTGLKDLPGFEFAEFWDKLIGCKVDDTVDYKVTVPENYVNKELQGQEAEFSVTVTEIKGVALKPLDEWAKEMDYDNGDEVKEEIRKRLESEIEHHQNDMAEAKLVEHLLDNNNFDLPDEMIKEQNDSVVERQRTSMQEEGKEEAEIEKALDELKENSHNSMTRSFKTVFIVDKIAKKEKIFVTESDINETLGKMAAQYNVPLEDFRNYMEQQGRLNDIRAQVKDEKVRGFLREKAVITWTEPVDKDEKPAKKKATKKKASKKKTTKE